jgi:hypothetical protein
MTILNLMAIRKIGICAASGSVHLTYRRVEMDACARNEITTKTDQHRAPTSSIILGKMKGAPKCGSLSQPQDLALFGPILFAKNKQKKLVVCALGSQSCNCPRNCGTITSTGDLIVLKHPFKLMLHFRACVDHAQNGEKWTEVKMESR